MKIDCLFVKEENKYCSNIAAFKALLQANDDIKFEGDTLKVNGFSAKYSIKSELVNDNKERLFYVSLTNEDGKEKDQATKLGEVSKEVRKIILGLEIGFCASTLRDGVSHYYCKESYPLISILENLMRKLISQFMIKNLGIERFDKGLPQEVKEKLKTNSQRQKYVEDRILEADFILLKDFLLKKYTKGDSNKMFEEMDKLDGKKLTKFKESYMPISNWDRYFGSKLKITAIEFDNKWSSLYKYRIMVAHNKIMNKNDFKCLKDLFEIMKDILEKGFENLEEIKVPQIDKSYVYIPATNLLNIPNHLIQNISNITFNNSVWNGVELGNIMTPINTCKSLEGFDKPINSIYTSGTVATSMCIDTDHVCENCSKSFNKSVYFLCPYCNSIGINNKESRTL